MTPLERAKAAIRAVFERRAEEYGNWITDPHPESGAWSYEGEIATGEIARAVIEAIREPSSNMQQAAFHQKVSFRSASGMSDVGQVSVEYDGDPEKGAATLWTAMIDALLAEGK